MKKRKVGVINAPFLDGNLFESGQRFTRDEIEGRRRERFHLTWEDQRRLHAEDLEPPGLTAFYAAIQNQMLKLFQCYGIDIPDGVEVTWEQWRRLAILQAIQNRDINIVVDGVPLPVLGDGEEISASSSVRLAQGARHAADRHEHICMIFNKQLASAPTHKNGKPNQTLAAKKTLEILQEHYPGEYPSDF